MAPVEQTRGRVCVLNGNRESGVGWMQRSEGLRLHPIPDSRCPTPALSHAAIFIVAFPSLVLAINIPPPPLMPKATLNTAGLPRIVLRVAVT